MKKTNYIYALLLLILTACSAAEPTTVMQGALVIRLVEAASETGETRGTPSELEKPLAENFELKITNQETNKNSYNGLFSGFKMPAYLNPATYTLDVSHGENPRYGFDKPFYRGALADLKITTAKETVAEIPCELANALASVTYTNQKLFDDLFTTYAIEAKIGNEQVAWDPMDKTNLYFREKESIALFLKGVMRKNGDPFTFPLATIELAKAKTNYRYDLTIENTNPNEALFDIQIDHTVEEVTISETLPDAWLPKPIITTEGFDNSICTVVETLTGVPAKLSIKAVTPIEEVTLTLNFEDANLKALNNTYTLSTLTEQDRLQLTNAGIVLPELGKNESVLDFTTLNDSLKTVNKGSTVDNLISVVIKANKRESDACDLTLQVVKPIFTPICYPGHIWTKQFQASLIVEKGNPEKIQNNLISEWSVDGINWTKIPKELAIKALTPNTAYFVRATYRDIISDVYKFKTYPEIALANGGLELYTKSSVDGKIRQPGAQYEWTSWATINELTTPDCGWANYSYNTRSGSRPTLTGHSHSGNAVSISTIGHGYGGTSSSPKFVSPGELFLGVYNTKGINYVSRPTAVRFWYKYFPYDTDKSDIKIEILNGTTVIGKGGLQQDKTINVYAEHKIAVIYDEQYKHLAPEKISLVFKSGFNTSKRKLGNNDYNYDWIMFEGSQLFIDEVSLVYDK